MKKLALLVKGFGIDKDIQSEPEVLPNGLLGFDIFGNPRVQSPWGFFSTFPLLPAAAVAAGTDKFLLTLGTGTEVIARATKGGVNVKTQATSPADNDNAMLIGIDTTASRAPIREASRILFAARVSLTQITELVFGAGLDENITSPIGTATAGDGAQFLFDPAGENTAIATALGAAALTNFILATKVDGTDAYQDSGITVNAGRDYELMVELGADLKANYYIDGVLVGTSATALTSGDQVYAVVGVQINAASPAGQKDFDARYVSLSRRVG